MSVAVDRLLHCFDQLDGFLSNKKLCGDIRPLILYPDNALFVVISTPTGGKQSRTSCWKLKSQITKAQASIHAFTSIAIFPSFQARFLLAIFFSVLFPVNHLLVNSIIRLFSSIPSIWQSKARWLQNCAKVVAMMIYLHRIWYAVAGHDLKVVWPQH